MYQSPQINEIATALSKAQAKMTSVRKDKKNPHFKSAYVSLDAVVESIRDVLAENGLAHMQTFQTEGNTTHLCTLLTHVSGQWIASKVMVPDSKGNIQQFLSSVTYLRRASLSAMVGVTPDEDDDAESVVRPAAQKASQKVVAFLSLKQLEALENKMLGDEELEEKVKQRWGSMDKIPADSFQLVYQSACESFDRRKQPRRE